MSLATFKKKTQAKYHNNSVNEVQFSTVGAYRNQGRVGQSTQSRSLTGPNSNGTTLCSKNDNTVVKKASMNTNGMLMSRYRWLRRPYDAAQPLNSISLKPGAGNILYGSQDAYIERKRKEAMCCEAVTVTNFAHTLLSYFPSSIAHSKNTIIGLVTPLSYRSGLTNQETNQSNVIILDGALGSSITTANMTTTLENAGYVKDGSSYTKYNVGDNNTSNTVSLSDTTANYLNNLNLTATSTTTFTTFSLDGNVEINTSEHTVTLVDYELSQLATHVNTRKGSLLTDGDVFFANTGVLLQYGDLYTNTPNVTVPNIFGDATSNNDIEKVGVMAGLLTAGAQASGNADYELSTNDLQLLVYAIYYQSTSTRITAESIIIAYQALQVGLTRLLTTATKDRIQGRISTGQVTTQAAQTALAEVTALEALLNAIAPQLTALRNALERIESGNPTSSQGWGAVNTIQQAITQSPIPNNLQSTITSNLNTISIQLTAVKTGVTLLNGQLSALATSGALTDAQKQTIQVAIATLTTTVDTLLGEIAKLQTRVSGQNITAQEIQTTVSTTLTTLLPPLRTTITNLITLVSSLSEDLVNTVDVKVADAVKTVELPGNPVDLSSVFPTYIRSLSNWPFPAPDPLTGQYFNGNNLVEGSNITDAQLTAFNRLAELQADQELARIILVYQYYKTQVFINWIGGAGGYKNTVETLTNSLVIDKIKNNLTMGELIRMGNLYNNAWTKRNIKTPLPMVAINLFYQLLNDYNDYGGNTDSHLIGYNTNGGYIKEDAPYSRNRLTRFSDWDDAETNFYDFFWVMVNILYVNNSYPAPTNRDAVLYQINPYDSNLDIVSPATKTVKVSDVLAFKVNGKDVFAVPDKYIQMSTVMYANQAYQSTHSAASLPAMSFVNLENRSGSLTDFLTEWDKFYNSLTAVISNLNNRSSIPYAVPTIGDIISVNNSFYLVSGYSTSNTTRTSSYNSQLLTGTNLGDFSVYTLFGTISGITGTPSSTLKNQILTALQYIQVSNTYVLFRSTPLSAGARELIADVISVIQNNNNDTNSQLENTTLRQFTSIETTGSSKQDTQGTLTATTLTISSRNSDIIAKATEVNNQFARLVTWVTTTIGGIYTGAITDISNNGFNYLNTTPVNTIGIRSGSTTIQERGILGSLYYIGALTGGGISFSLNTEQLERLMAIIYIWSSLSISLLISQLQSGIASITAALQTISDNNPNGQIQIITTLEYAAHAIRTNLSSGQTDADKLYTVSPSVVSGNVVSVPSNWYAIGLTPPGTPDNDSNTLSSSEKWKDIPRYGNPRGLTAYGSTHVSVYHNSEARQHLATAQTALTNAQTALVNDPSTAITLVNSAVASINSAATSINSAYLYANDAYTAANTLSSYTSYSAVNNAINYTRTAKDGLDTLKTTIAALQSLSSGSQLTEAVILTFMLQDDGFDENYLVTSNILTETQLTTLKTTIYTAFATGAGQAILAAPQERLTYEGAQRSYAAAQVVANQSDAYLKSLWEGREAFWLKQVQTTTSAITALTSTLTLLATALGTAAQTSGQPGANDHLKEFVNQAVGNTNIKPLRNNNVFYIQRTDVNNNTSAIDLAYEYRNDSNYEPMTSIQKYYVNGLAILNADQSLFRSYARLSLLSQVQLFWTSELQSQLASIGEGTLSSYVDVINLLQTKLVVNVIETEAQLFIVKVLNAVYKLRRTSNNNTKLDYKALMVLYILLSYVIDFSPGLNDADFELRTDNNGDPVFIKSDPEPVLVIDVNNSVQIDNNNGSYIIDSFNSSVGSAFEITDTTVTIANIRTSNNGKVKIESGGGNYDLLIQNLANFFYVYTETSNKFSSTTDNYMFYITEFDNPDNTNTVYPSFYTLTSAFYTTYDLRREYFYLYNTMSFAASLDQTVETNLNNILTQADDFTTAINDMKTTLAGGSNPNSVVTIGDVVRINGRFYVLQSNDANELVVINKDDSSVSIKEGSTIHLVYKGDTTTPNVYLDTPGPIGTSLLSGENVTTTKSKDCCLLDIDKAFLDQNNQQKRCGSTNTCG